jgi:hypothetical protein
MAETGRLSLPAARPLGLPLRPVTVLRIAIIVAVVAIWEAVSASGWLYRDVVPSLVAIGKALYVTLGDPFLFPPRHHRLGDRHRHGDRRLAGSWSALCSAAAGSCRAPASLLYYLGPVPRSSSFPS